MTSSLALCDLLDNHCGNVCIKWPNDILAGNDKIAGILIESSILGSQIENCVAGIGLNLNQEKFGDYSPRAVSLRMITGKDYDRSTMLRDLLSCFDNRYKDLLYGDRSGIRQNYTSRLYRHMQWTRFNSGGVVFEGRITGVSVTGQILIEERNGNKREFSFREFRYLF
jgi:BirA family biotin operon repressor/biotin-[acetyl-CoA-carboxylase] ligase